MSKSNSSSFFVGSLITSLVGAFLLVLEDFAGWYNYGYYAESWGWIGLSIDTPLAVALILVVVLALLYTSFISVKGLQLKGEINKRTIRSGLIASSLAFVIVLVGAITFVVSILESEPSEWWFGAGFYGGLLGSGLTALLFFFQHRSPVEANASGSTRP
ncbi:MAG TPA: hypothetical protein VJ249_03695 [Candidatus Bathyarchaeia archaeon]|nr:hypothetical protein [Candidatus Bathyarchaeia archaeon]